MGRIESLKKAQIKYVENNREKINEINRKSQKKKYHEDEAFREDRKRRARERYQKIKEKKRMEKELNMAIEEREEELERFNKIVIELTEGMDSERKDLFISNLREAGKGDKLDALGYFTK